MSRLTRDSRTPLQRLENELRRLRRRTTIGTGGSGFTASIPVHRFAVDVKSDTGAAQTGVIAVRFTRTLERFIAGALTAAPETVTVTEISGGQYALSLTPTLPGVSYRLRISVKPDGTNLGTVTPSEIVFVSTQLLT